jgi:FtsZ-binding cell division protein ZapB
MLWEELQTDIATQIGTLTTTQVERAVTEANARIIAGVDSLRQDVDTFRNNKNNESGALIQTLKVEHKATVEGLQVEVAEVGEASKISQEVLAREAKDNQQVIEGLKQEVETLHGSNKDLTKRLEKVEWVFQGMAQLYGSNDRKEPSAGQS